jgi:hypothetical protein
VLGIEAKQPFFLKQTFVEENKTFPRICEKQSFTRIIDDII